MDEKKKRICKNLPFQQGFGKCQKKNAAENMKRSVYSKEAPEA